MRSPCASRSVIFISAMIALLLTGCALLSAASVHVVAHDELCLDRKDEKPSTLFNPLSLSNMNYCTTRKNRAKIAGSHPSFKVNSCNVRFVLELGRAFTTVDVGFVDIKYFLTQTTSACFDRNIGKQIYVEPLFNNSLELNCCHQTGCEFNFANLEYDEWVSPMDKAPIVTDGSANENFAEWLINELKRFDDPQERCRDNTFVLVSNRVYGNLSDKIIDNMLEVLTFSCTTLSIVIVGREELSLEEIEKYYLGITDQIFSVPDYNCLQNLKECIFPCGGNNCSSGHFTGCAEPTTTKITQISLLPTTRTVTTRTTPVGANSTEEVLDASWHLIYIFAISDTANQSDFKDVENAIRKPLDDCFKYDNQNITVKFLTNNTDPGIWSHSSQEIDSELAKIVYNKSKMHVSVPCDCNDTDTLRLVIDAMNQLNPGAEEQREPRQPRITLITDFASDPFIKELQNSNFLKQINAYDFQFIIIGNASGYYYNDNSIQHKQITVAVDFHSIPTGNVCDDPNTSKEASVSLPTIILIATGGGVLLLLFLVGLTICYRQKLVWMKRLDRFRQTHDDRADDENQLFDHWELSWDKLVVNEDKLGSGAYGQVYRGKLIGKSPMNEIYQTHLAARMFEDCDVAVKMLPKYASDTARSEFMTEIDFMKTVGYNEHIVNMLGCVTVGTPICLVLEYCSNRDLLRYLRSRHSDFDGTSPIEVTALCLKDLLVIAWQIADGMRYLSSKSVIHRDLAARNVLINEDKNAKISDFGLCTTVSEQKQGTYTSGSGRLPIKWMAFESLTKHEFSVKSDVWSFGIVLYEIYTLGQIPFVLIDPKELIQHLQAGNRPEQPDMATDDIYEIMTDCWRKEPNDRPSFDELRNRLANLLEQATEGYGYLPLLRCQTYAGLSSLCIEGNELMGTKKRPSLVVVPSEPFLSVPSRTSLSESSTNVTIIIGDEEPSDDKT